jgi:hypothetical protein
METLASAGNILFPAVLALRQLGFAVSLRREGDHEVWQAERDDLRLLADDPLALLGLATLRDQRGPDWAATDPEIQALLDEFYGSEDGPGTAPPH